MELEKELLNKIELGRQEFQNDTMFMANWLKCNIVSRIKICSLIDDKGEIKGTGLKVIIDWDLPDNECRIGMGQGPTYSTINI